MNHRILIQVTAPAVVIGLLLFGACLIGAWQISRLQSNMQHIVADNVASLPRVAASWKSASGGFASTASFTWPAPTPKCSNAFTSTTNALRYGWLGNSRAPGARRSNAASRSLKPGTCATARSSIDKAQQVARKGPFKDLGELANANPVQHVIDPCRELLRLNEEQMEQTFQDAATVSGQVRTVMQLLGFLGPLSGIIIGYGIARGLSRSIYQLSVRVQSMAQRLDQDVASVSVAADGDIQNLDKQLQQVVDRVEEVAERLQRQQRDMLRAEQLSAVGQLAASVAHEVRNPLASIKLLVEAARAAQTRCR